MLYTFGVLAPGNTPTSIPATLRLADLSTMHGLENNNIIVHLKYVRIDT